MPAPPKSQKRLALSGPLLEISSLCNLVQKSNKSTNWTMTRTAFQVYEIKHLTIMHLSLGTPTLPPWRNEGHTWGKVVDLLIKLPHVVGDLCILDTLHKLLLYNVMGYLGTFGNKLVTKKAGMKRNMQLKSLASFPKYVKIIFKIYSQVIPRAQNIHSYEIRAWYILKSYKENI